MKKIVVNKNENKAIFTTFFYADNLDQMVEFSKSLGCTPEMEYTEEDLRDEINPFKKAKNLPIDWSSARTYHIIMQLHIEGLDEWDLCHEASTKLVGNEDSGMAIYMRLPKILSSYIRFNEIDGVYNTDEEKLMVFSKQMAKHSLTKKQRRLPVGTKILYGKDKTKGVITGYDQNNGDYEIKCGERTLCNIYRKELEHIEYSCKKE